MKTRATVIISTYNQPEWLEKVLWGYELQTVNDFDIIIADDGSGEATKNCIDRFIDRSALHIQHIWQEDRGFRKTTILNKAIAAASSDYLIMTDGDCIPRSNFVEKHLKLRKKGCFLSGGYFKLPMSISKAITKTDIESQNCFKVMWLREKGMKKTFKAIKLTQNPFKAWLLNSFTTTKATWDGNNVSGWKADIVAVNGFDERMQYGGEDREMGERLMNYGIIPLQIRYSVVCLHLHHEKGYVTDAMIEANREIRKITRRKELTYTPYGIVKAD